MDVIRTHNLTKIYQNRVIAVSGVNLTVKEGWVFGLLGPNGAGKTTLLKMVLGLQLPTAGRVEVFGEVMTPNAAHLRQRIGYLPTNPKFPPNMTPITYLDFVGQLFGLPKEVRKPRLAALLRAVDLLPAQSQPIRSFSTGMTTRLGIAAALMNDPDLLLLDEPTAGLDPAGRKYTLDLIRALGQTKTIVIASHILSDIDRVCDHVGIIHEGKLIFQGPMRLFRQSVGRNRVEIELGGKETALSALFARMEQMPEIESFDRNGSWLTVSFSNANGFAASLGKLLLAASELGVEVFSVASLRGQAEEAFIHLLEVDQSHGFTRAYEQLGSLPDGVERALPSRLDGAE